MRFEQFEKYGLNELSSEERQLLEAEFSKNKDLTEGIRDFRGFLSALDKLGLRDLRNKLIRLQKDLERDEFFLTEEELDDYVMGKGRETDLTVLNKIQSNPHFQKIAQDYGKIIEMVETDGIQNLKAKLSTAEKNLEQKGFFQEKGAGNFGKAPKTYQIGRRRILMPLAALLLVLLGVFYVLSLQPEIPNIDYTWTQSHLNQSIEDSRVPGFMIRNKEMLASRASILDTVKNKRYAEANLLWADHLNRWPNDNLGRFYYAHCLRETRQYSEAIQEYEVFLNKPDFQYPDDVIFHLALSYIEVRGGCEKGISLLERLISEHPESEYFPKALAYRDQIGDCP